MDSRFYKSGNRVRPASIARPRGHHLERTRSIKSIWKSYRTLTEYGKQCVLPERSKVTYNLEHLKIVVRLMYHGTRRRSRSYLNSGLNAYMTRSQPMGTPSRLTILEPQPAQNCRRRHAKTGSHRQEAEQVRGLAQQQDHQREQRLGPAGRRHGCLRINRNALFHGCRQTHDGYQTRGRTSRAASGSNTGGGTMDSVVDTFVNASSRVHTPDKRSTAFSEWANKLAGDLNHAGIHRRARGQQLDLTFSQSRRMSSSRLLEYAACPASTMQLRQPLHRSSSPDWKALSLPAHSSYKSPWNMPGGIDLKATER
ncbi:hypothetical protein HBI68_220980 [Parastagonospora nodorum]|nr:hypothetical protein HBI68_220980 [Parastagonospora nodorum]